MEVIHLAAGALVVAGVLAGLRVSAVMSRRRRSRPAGARAGRLDSLVGALGGGLAAVLVSAVLLAALSDSGRAEGPQQILAAVDPDAAVRQSTVRVVGRGCGGVAQGSGFVVRDGAVLTNAHVVAGLHDIEVWTGSGHRHAAVLTVFDAKRDLAVLRAVGLGVPALEPTPSPVERTQVVSIYGYPDGATTVTSIASQVTQRTVVSGVDIYGRSAADREVLFLSGELAPGISGGPVVDAAARYVGVAFASRATARTAGSGFALADREVSAVVQAYAADPRGTVGPTACVETRR